METAKRCKRESNEGRRAPTAARNFQTVRSSVDTVHGSISSSMDNWFRWNIIIISISRHSILLIINHRLIFRICLRAFPPTSPCPLCVEPSHSAAPLALVAATIFRPSFSTLFPPAVANDLGSPDAWNTWKISVLLIKRIDATAYPAVSRASLSLSLSLCAAIVRPDIIAAGNFPSKVFDDAQQDRVLSYAEWQCTRTRRWTVDVWHRADRTIVTFAGA